MDETADLIVKVRDFRDNSHLLSAPYAEVRSYCTLLRRTFEALEISPYLHYAHIHHSRGGGCTDDNIMSQATWENEEWLDLVTGDRVSVYVHITNVERTHFLRPNPLREPVRPELSQQPLSRTEDRGVAGGSRMQMYGPSVQRSLPLSRVPAKRPVALTSEADALYQKQRLDWIFGGPPPDKVATAETISDNANPSPRRRVPRSLPLNAVDTTTGSPAVPTFPNVRGSTVVETIERGQSQSRFEHNRHARCVV